MGGGQSKQKRKSQKPMTPPANTMPPPIVLVPPLFECDHKGRSRLAKSSFDYLFCKPNLRWLFNDYLPCGMASLLHFSPPEDPRVSLTARLGASIQPPESFSADALKNVQLGEGLYGCASLRFQTTPTHPSNFIDLKVSTKGEGTARARGCYYNPQNGLGVFGVLPLVVENPDETPDASLGFRYSTPHISMGLVVNPFTETIKQIWLVGRNGPVTAGVQLESPNVRQFLSEKSRQERWDDIRACSSYAIAYTPENTAVGRGNFTAALEVQRQERLVMSILHHMAVQRRCWNPREDNDIVGITNYIDFGLQVDTNLIKGGRRVTPGSEAAASAKDADSDTALRLAAAWQANKNVLLKARVGTDAAVASLAFKAWWQPSFAAAVSAGYDLRTRRPRVGLVFNVQNYGNIRYEKGQRTAYGGTLVQRHVALPQDLANREGRGLLVQKADQDNPGILGQTTTPNSFVL